MLNLGALPQPGRARALLNEIVAPAMTLLSSLGVPFPTNDPRVLRPLIAISGQEADMQYRDQIESPSGDLVDGPAMGLWQFERGGAVKGVVQHIASRQWAIKLCAERHVSFDTYSIWKALETDDILAAGMARLLIWTDPWPLPTSQAAVWEMYEKRLWRPGKPHPDKWPGYWALATQVVEDSK